VKTKYLLLLITVPVVVLADQLTKLWAMASLKQLILQSSPAERFITVIDGFFRFYYTENPGAAWGLLRDASPGFRIPFFIVVSLVAIAFVLWYLTKLGSQQKLQAFSISLILGGALGNLIDRIRIGRVVDFIQWYVVVENPINLGVTMIEPGEKYWPTFNIADVAITIGVMLLIGEMIFRRGPIEEEKK
jgi:signal peptidase II